MRQVVSYEYALKKTEEDRLGGGAEGAVQGAGRVQSVIWVVVMGVYTYMSSLTCIPKICTLEMNHKNRAGLRDEWENELQF